MKKQKLFEKILAGSKNIQFSELVSLIEAFGFSLSRIKGSHYIFNHPKIPEQVNIQKKGNQAKPYQISQFLTLLEQYNLKLGEDS